MLSFARPAIHGIDAVVLINVNVAHGLKMEEQMTGKCTYVGPPSGYTIPPLFAQR